MHSVLFCYNTPENVPNRALSHGSVAATACKKRVQRCWEGHVVSKKSVNFDFCECRRRPLVTRTNREQKHWRIPSLTPISTTKSLKVWALLRDEICTSESVFIYMFTCDNVLNNMPALALSIVEMGALTMRYFALETIVERSK